MRQRLTKLIATATLLSVCGSAYGQAEVWACQAVRSAGLAWENGTWVVSGFVPLNYLVRIDDENSSYTLEGTTYPMVCQYSIFDGAFFHNCLGDYAQNLALNTESGSGGVSSINGGVSNGAIRDSVYAAVLQCTKF